MQRAKDNKSALVDEDNGSTFFAEVEYLMNYVFLFFEIFRVFQGGRKEPPLCGQRLCLLAGGGGGWCGGGGVQILGYFWTSNGLSLPFIVIFTSFSY